ncbi:M15 family metallopeptidase [Aquabacterium sp.]|uniref:M15 family metallopeptidase n=1 Tax=Aquabacterium sp. TaxID=1872578 RepID=UPI002CA79178|nr:M15 family metallopeptidase [Aquabacterium sp.]HSW03833.1 M15 family metallopeptidase [Aquabacterium sp.]
MTGGLIRCEDIATHPAFRPLAGLRGVAHDLRYACSNNFAGRPLYVGLDCAWLRNEAAAGLEAAAAWLSREHPGHGLLVLDALRPQRVQEAIWADVAGTDMAHYFAEPTRGSIHSFGMAVDVALLNPQGQECDMGAGFDEMTARSHPALEAVHLANGVLTPAHLDARHLLYVAMAHGGFHGIPTEWWHFDHGDRELVRREFLRVY